MSHICLVTEHQHGKNVELQFKIKIHISKIKNIKETVQKSDKITNNLRRLQSPGDLWPGYGEPGQGREALLKGQSVLRT